MELIVNDRIRKRKISFFNEVKVNLKFDSVASTFSLKFYFDPTNKEHAELACVSHFHEAYIEHNGERLLTGYILSNVFNSGAKKQLVEIAGYSKAGIIEDCEIPTSQYPLEWTGLTLIEIAQKIISIFKGIRLKVDSSASSAAQLAFTNISDPNVGDDGTFTDNGGTPAVSTTETLEGGLNKKIDKANANETQNIKSYLTELAAQRNILLSHDEYGNLLFTEAKTSQTPIVYFEIPPETFNESTDQLEGGSIPGVTMHMSFNGQAIHSHITIIGQQDIDGGNAPEFTIQNPYCPILYRPKVIKQTSGTDITIEESARQALSAELKNIVLTITLDRWDINGKLIRPNTIISVYNPECFIYKKTNFFVEEVSFDGDSKKQTATLTCVLPEVYNKLGVKNIFVDVHDNFPRF